MDIRKSQDVPHQIREKCHGGEGTLQCLNLLDGVESTGLHLMHHDFLPAGVSVGKHAHLRNEEVYYLLSGRGILTYDEQTYEMNAGDISLCTRGHSHAYVALEDSVMIVVATKRDPQ